MVIDFHSHIMPKVDDGAKSLEMSLEMMKKSAEMGVDTIVSTSHCYPYSEEDIERFLSKRKSAFERIAEFCDVPKIRLGCEVHLTCDISRFSNIEKLCIENTRYMLVEMPVSNWDENQVEYIYRLTAKGIVPIIAHDERNAHQKHELRQMIYDLDVLAQLNAPSLFIPRFKKEIDNLMKRGIVHVLGTDMHNMDTRKPCFADTKKALDKRYGKKCWEYFMNNSERILNNEEISYKDFQYFKRQRFWRE